MTAEALPMVERLGLQQDAVFPSPAPCLSWSGKQFGLQIHLVQNGQQMLLFTYSKLAEFTIIPALLTSVTWHQKYFEIE